MDELRNQVHKWREDRQQKMVLRLTKKSNSEEKIHLNPSILGVKQSSCFSGASRQVVIGGKSQRRAPVEVRQTKTSSRRQLLANPLLEPKNVELLENFKRRQTFCFEKNSNEVIKPKGIVKETHREQMLKIMGKYDLNGRRLTMCTSSDVKEGKMDAKCKTSENKNYTNSKQHISDKRTNPYENNKSKTVSEIQLNKKKVKNQILVKSFSNLQTSRAPLGVKSSQSYNAELAEFEMNHCISDTGASSYQDSNTLPNQNRETITLCKEKLPSSAMTQNPRRMDFLKINNSDHKCLSEIQSSSCGLTDMLKNNKFPFLKEGKLNKRRSLSQEHLQRKKIISLGRKSTSVEELNIICKKVKFVSPITEETSPVLADLTRPRSSRSERPSISTPRNILQPSYLAEKRNKLRKWLTERGKPECSYRHLQCFDLHRLPKEDHFKACKNQTPTVENLEDKPCASSPTVDVPDDFNEGNKENVTPLSERNEGENLKHVMHVMREALIDLRNLVKTGYDHDECDVWIQALKKHCPRICDCVEYWECLASLDEAKGDYNMAVDSYQRAIVRGAEVEDINKQLDGLLSKMNHLHLDIPEKDKKSTSPRGINIKNIFKSKVIQFALQQKAVKKLSNDLGEKTEVLYIATPVRRSTRRNAFDPKCLRTLDDLEPEKKCLTKFQTNPALK